MCSSLVPKSVHTPNRNLLNTRMHTRTYIIMYTVPCSANLLIFGASFLSLLFLLLFGLQQLISMLCGLLHTTTEAVMATYPHGYVHIYLTRSN